MVTFITTSLILGFIPGPDNMFVLTQAALRGWRVGMSVTFGLLAKLATSHRCDNVTAAQVIAL
ncbi:hypothetical protein [Pararhizobium sp. A13]|uniref:hypothetical protein n=1 Tax=Pararhizobium sp. A13 TaxID=3133975 RepID=UPI00311AE5F6